MFLKKLDVQPTDELIVKALINDQQRWLDECEAALANDGFVHNANETYVSDWYPFDSKEQVVDEIDMLQRRIRLARQFRLFKKEYDEYLKAAMANTPVDEKSDVGVKGWLYEQLTNSYMFLPGHNEECYAIDSIWYKEQTDCYDLFRCHASSDAEPLTSLQDTLDLLHTLCIDLTNDQLLKLQQFWTDCPTGRILFV